MRSPGPATLCNRGSLPAVLSFVLAASPVAGAPALPAQEVPAAIEARYQEYMRFPEYVDGGVVIPHWYEGGERFWYAEGAPADTVVWSVKAADGAREQLFDIGRLRAALTDELGHDPPWNGVPFSSFRIVDGGAAVRFELQEAVFRLDLEGYTLTREPGRSPREQERAMPRVTRIAFPHTGADAWEVRSPDGRWYAGECGDDLCLRSSADGRSRPLTTSGEEDLAWSVAGASWSSDGLRLAASRVDTRHVDKATIVHWLEPVEEIERLPFPRAGSSFPLGELFVIDVLSGNTTRIDDGGPGDRLLSIIGWTDDGSELLFYRMDRSFERLQVRAGNPGTGESRLLLEERQATFIKGIAGSPGWSQLFTPLPESDGFLWISERDGWDHLYLHDGEGNLVRRLTSGEWPVLGIVAVDEADGWVYFTANGEERPYDTHLYRVGLNGEGFARLTEGAGRHAASFAPDRASFVDNWSSARTPPVSELRRADGTLVTVLDEADISRAVNELGWSAPEEFAVRAADGETMIYGTLFRPADFDPSRKYPVLDHIYNGPQTTWVPRTFLHGSGMWMQALAQLGFVVFAVDGRGTTERGKAFQDVAYGDFGGHEIDDHAAALRQLAADRPYMDTDRVGIFGGSWGGYMTVRALLTRPDVYHVGVATNGVYEMYDHAALAIEPYMGLPGERPAAFEAGSSLRLADQLEGKLLVIGSALDVNGTFSATMKLVQAFVQAGERFDLVVFPDQNHHPAGAGGRYYRDLHKWYFVEHLQPRSHAAGAGGGEQ